MGDEEQGAGHQDSERIKAGRRLDARGAVCVEDRHLGYGGIRAAFQGWRLGGHDKLVRNADCLRDEHILVASVATLPPAERFDLALVAEIVLNVALDGFANGQARSNQGLELDDIRVGELEGVERSAQHFLGAVVCVDRSHDLLVGRAAALVDEEDLVVVDPVRGDELANEDGVRRVLLLDLEQQAEGIANLGSEDVPAVPGSDLHDDSWCRHNSRLLGNRRHSAGHRKVQPALEGIILQLVRAAESETDILTRHDLIVMLNKHSRLKS